MMLVAMMTAMAITRERERNIFEQLAASPRYEHGKKIRRK
jgi:hypothetical protein